MRKELKRLRKLVDDAFFELPAREDNEHNELYLAFEDMYNYIDHLIEDLEEKSALKKKDDSQA